MIINDVVITRLMSNEVKNFFLAVSISLIIFLGFNYFYPQVEPVKSQADKVETKPISKTIEPEALSPTILERKDALQLSSRIPFENKVVVGTVNLNNGTIDDLQLKDYKATLQKNSPDITLLSPYDTAKAMVVSINLINADTPKADETTWTEITTDERNKVSIAKTLPTMTITRTFTFGDDYTIAINDKIVNTSNSAIKLRSIQKLIMSEQDTIDSFTSIADGKLHEHTPAQLTKKDIINYPMHTGWVGAGTKYWFTAFMQNKKTDSSILLNKINRGYEISLLSPTTVIGKKQTIDNSYLCFCGPKKLAVLQSIRDKKHVDKFDLAVDFGWFYFITKPLLEFINKIHGYIGNFGWAIIILTTLMKILLWPLAIKSHKSMVAMRALQPKMNKIKEKYASDKIRMNQEIMNLYKQEHVKPMGGCLPIILQIPLFFCLYKVLSINIEMRHAPFIGWIKDLSEPDPTSFLNLFGLLPFEAPSVFMIGLLPILMGVTMFLQQKLTPSVGADPAQERVMLLMPFFLTYVFASFPSGLVIYWLWTNVLSILQQIWMNKHYS